MDQLRPMVTGYILGRGMFFGVLMAGAIFKTAAGGVVPGPSAIPLLSALAAGLAPTVLPSVGLGVATVWLLPHAARFVFDRAESARTVATRARARRMRRRERVWLAIVLAAVVIVAGISLLVPGGMMAMGVLAGPQGMSCGMACVLMAFRARTGTACVCARCDYRMGSFRGAPAQCPECGHKWKLNWGARLGTRGVSWRLVAAGISMIIGALLVGALFWLRA